MTDSIIPTQPGLYRDKDGDIWYVNNEGERKMLSVKGTPVEDLYWPWGDDDREYAPFTPVTLVPTEKWDRLRVLDPEDKRDRVDVWGELFSRDNFQSDDNWRRSLMSRTVYRGPLRFADEANVEED